MNFSNHYPGIDSKELRALVSPKQQSYIENVIKILCLAYTVIIRCHYRTLGLALGRGRKSLRPQDKHFFDFLHHIELSVHLVTFVVLFLFLLVHLVGWLVVFLESFSSVGFI